MIRTRIVELSTIEAIAYRRKLKGGRTGIVIQRADSAQPGLALVDGKSGTPDIAANTPAALYPAEAFAEAQELTAGLPYTSRGAVKFVPATEAAPDDEEDAPEEAAAVDSAEYEAIVKAYTNRKGELSYELLNKDFIQFAKSSKVVTDLVAARADVDAIRNHVVRVKLEQLTGNRSLSDAQIATIVEMLDAVSPRHVFREVNDEIRRMLAR